MKGNLIAIEGIDEYVKLVAGRSLYNLLNTQGYSACLISSLQVISRNTAEDNIRKKLSDIESHLKLIETEKTIIIANGHRLKTRAHSRLNNLDIDFNKAFRYNAENNGDEREIMKPDLTFFIDTDPLESFFRMKFISKSDLTAGCTPYTLEVLRSYYLEEISKTKEKIRIINLLEKDQSNNYMLSASLNEKTRV